MCLGQLKAGSAGIAEGLLHSVLEEEKGGSVQQRRLQPRVHVLLVAGRRC